MAADKNGVIFQAFQWHYEPAGGLWTELTERAGELAALGFTAAWLPPPYKGADGASDVGYAVYDLYDLGEFDQKGTTPTKYGTKPELLWCVRALQKNGIYVLGDVVLNHRIGADEQEEVDLVAVRGEDRTRAAGDRFRASVWTKFTFPGRNGHYSPFHWDAQHFTAVDNIAGETTPGQLFLLNGKGFQPGVSDEFGNFDYLMGCDVDLSRDDVRDELFAWGRWFLDTTGIDGFRLDAVKHMPATFVRDLLNHLRAHFSRNELFAVGEYWVGDVGKLEGYVADTDDTLHLFDVPLHFNLHAASEAGRDYDLKKIFDGTLVARRPDRAVTFVDNHDSQPDQALASWVKDWFKPIAYALILLRREGFPCVFYGDFFGSDRDGTELTSFEAPLRKLLKARQLFNWGEQHDYFDHDNCAGWVRTGDEAHAHPMAVVVSNGDDGTKRMQTVRKDCEFVDALGNWADTVWSDADGWADFRCKANGVSAWVPKDALTKDEEAT